MTSSSACAAPTCPSRRVSLPRGPRRQGDVGASRGAARAFTAAVWVGPGAPPRGWAWAGRAWLVVNWSERAGGEKGEEDEAAISLAAWVGCGAHRFRIWAWRRRRRVVW